jgi:hypothetical protein
MDRPFFELLQLEFLTRIPDFWNHKKESHWIILSLFMRTKLSLGRPMPTCDPSAFEKACCVIVRSETFYPKTFFACQVVATVLVILLPLFVTNTASHGAASKECYDRAFALRNVTNFDVDSQYYDPEWDMDDDAVRALFPVHLLNSISTVMSLFGFWVWLFFSPHNSDVARELDRTCTEKTIAFLHQLHAQATTIIMCCHHHTMTPPHQHWCVTTVPTPPPLVPFTIATSLCFYFQWAVTLPFSGWRTSSLLRQR